MGVLAYWKYFNKKNKNKQPNKIKLPTLSMAILSIDDAWTIDGWDIN